MPKNISRKNTRKGYFFVFDSLLGLLILVSGILLINSLYVKQKEPAQVRLLADELLDFLSSTKIKDLNNPYAGIGGQLYTQGSISNADNTLLQQIGIFYKTKNYDTQERFIANVSNSIIPSQYRYEIWIGGELAYPRGPDFAHNQSKSRTGLLVASRRITFGILNSTTASTFGPYPAEVYLWER